MEGITGLIGKCDDEIKVLCRATSVFYEEEGGPSLFSSLISKSVTLELRGDVDNELLKSELKKLGISTFMFATFTIGDTTFASFGMLVDSDEEYDAAVEAIKQAASECTADFVVLCQLTKVNDESLDSAALARVPLVLLLALAASALLVH